MSRRLNITAPRKAPDVRRYVGVCMTCRHWQVDVRPGAVSDLGGAQSALMAMAEAHNEHLTDCPGVGGRVNFQGQWVEPPLMASGKAADGTMEFNPFPRWWCVR